MKRILLLEFRNCLNRNEFKFVFALLMLFSVAGFIITCFMYYGLGMTSTRSAFEMSIMRQFPVVTLVQIECLLLPLLASIIYSDSYYSDFQSGVYNSIATRTDFRSYLWSKSIVATVVAFLAFFIPLLLNQLLCLVAFPLQGFDNNFGFPPYDIGVQNYTKGLMFDLLRLQHPLLYNLLYMFLLSLAASLFALLVYGAFFLFKKNRFTTIAGVLLLYLVANVAIGALGSYRMCLPNLLLPENSGSAVILSTWMALLFVPGLVVLAVWSLKHEAGIEE